MHSIMLLLKKGRVVQPRLIMCVATSLERGGETRPCVLIAPVVLLCCCVVVLLCCCVGVLVCWCVGVLLCWCVGVLVCWCVGVSVWLFQVVANPRPVNAAPQCNPEYNPTFPVTIDGAQYVRYISWGEAQTMVYVALLFTPSCSPLRNMPSCSP